MRPYDLFLAHLFKDRDPGGYPFRLSVETTNHCNLGCDVCPRLTSGRSYAHIEREFFESLARQSAGEETIFYPQGFGESWLHPEFGQMLVYLNQNGVRCVDLITNGTKLTEPNCHTIIDSSTTIVTISIDGADPEIYERHRPGAKYEEVVDNIQRLLRLREERAAEFPIIVLSVVGTPEVMTTMPEFREFWRPKLRESDEIFVCSPVTWAGALSMPGRDPSPPKKDLSKRPPCRMIYKTLQVYHDGRATPCCYDHSCQLEVGNAKEQSVKEIWNGEPLQRLRELHEQGRSEEIELCRNCPDHMS